MSWFGLRWYEGYQNRYLDKAEQYLIDGNRKKAIRAFSAHIEHNPEDEVTAERLEDLQQEFRRRYLDAAEAHLKVGDKVAAIKEYRSHIEHYPGDHNVQLKLAKVYQQLNINDAAESLYRNIIDEMKDTDSRIEAVARERLLRHVNEWANGIKRHADELFEQGDFEAAAAEYERVISLRSRNPALFFDDVNQRFAVSALNNVIARRAFSLWRAGQEEALKTALQTEHDVDVFPGMSRDGELPPDVRRQRETMLANFFWDYADRLFKKENWRQAADMYGRVLKMRSEASEAGGDPNTPILLLNYAISEYRAGNPREAMQAIERIEKDYAYHEKARVRQLKQELENELGVRGEE